MKIFLGGEGSNELGSRAREPVYQSDEQPGVVQALLTKVSPSGWSVEGAIVWKSIRKFRSGDHASAEVRNVLGLVLDAKRAGAEAVAFVRDDDGAGRGPEIERGIERAHELFPAIGVIGGVALPVLEGWLLALSGQTKTEQLSKSAAQRHLEEQLGSSKNTAAMVACVETADLGNLPECATTLRSWLTRARAVLPDASAS